VPFRFDPADSAQGRRLLEQKGLPATRLPVVIRHDDYTIRRGHMRTDGGTDRAEY
jgi:hypothetical protein